MQRQTTIVNADKTKYTWYIVDATNESIGRLASEVATLLMGKHKPSYTPNFNCGDYVIVTNVKKIAVSSSKLKNKKYYNVSGYTGGLRTRTAGEMLKNYPVEMVKRIVWGMLPKGPLGRKMIKKLFVYPEDKHDKASQKPVEYKLKFGKNNNEKEKISN